MTKYEDLRDLYRDMHDLGSLYRNMHDLGDSYLKNPFLVRGRWESWVAFLCKER